MTGEADLAKQACPFKVVSLLSSSLQVTLARLTACPPFHSWNQEICVPLPLSLPAFCCQVMPATSPLSQPWNHSPPTNLAVLSSSKPKEKTFSFHPKPFPSIHSQGSSSLLGGVRNY